MNPAAPDGRSRMLFHELRSDFMRERSPPNFTEKAFCTHIYRNFEQNHVPAACFETKNIIAGAFFTKITVLKGKLSLFTF